MRAARIQEIGALPDLAEVDEPDGAVVEVLAAPLNPIDLAVSRGLYFGGHPALPYVPGCEAVGRTPDGRTVWSSPVGSVSTGTARSPNGPRSGTRSVWSCPEGADPALAGASASPGWRAGFRSPGARRSRAAKRCSFSGRRDPSGSSGFSREAARRRPGRGGGAQRRTARAGALARRRRDRPVGRRPRPRRGVPRGLRRRRAVVRLRPALGYARGGRGAGRGPARPRRQPRPVRGAGIVDRLGGGPREEPHDPRPHELPRPARRARRGVRAARRSRGDGSIALEVERVALDDVTYAWRRLAEGAQASS